jgi:hypothetical protein
MYCFEDTVSVPFTVKAWADKGAQMWSNETITFTGRLTPTESTEWYGSKGANAIPNATVTVRLDKPDLTGVMLNTTTDKNGYFSVSYNPTEVGNWGWLAWYQGEQKPIITYEETYTEYNTFEVTSPTPSETSTPSPSPPPSEGIPAEYIYAAVAIVAIVLIVAAVLLLRKRTAK